MQGDSVLLPGFDWCTGLKWPVTNPACPLGGMGSTSDAGIVVEASTTPVGVPEESRARISMTMPVGSFSPRATCTA